MLLTKNQLYLLTEFKPQEKKSVWLVKGLKVLIIECVIAFAAISVTFWNPGTIVGSKSGEPEIPN